MTESAKYLESTLSGSRDSRIDLLTMTMKQATDRYSTGNPIMSDAQYDALELELRKIDPKNALLKTVGAPVKPDKTGTGLAKIRHSVTMGSLNKAQSEAEVSSWFRKVSRSGDLVITEKLDGISVSLIYKNGNLVTAATRGDGTNGEDITRNVTLMRGVKKSIPGFTGEIRGEILILKSDFHNFPGASNTRNSAAGAAKSIHDNSKCKYCTVICYRVLGKTFDSKIQELGWLNSNSIPTVGMYYPARSVADIQRIYYNYINEKRASLDYDIDGLVIEVNNNEAALEILQDPSYPEYAIAYKFPHATGITTLRDIEWQIGHTGRITPVGIFDEVNLVGANVSRASLATWSFVKNMGLRKEDKIEVSRRNDVIPKIERVIEHSRLSQFLPPSQCPACNHTTETDGEYIICPNIGVCPAQIEGGISNWLRKVGVLEWGDAIVHELVEQDIVHNISDLYILDVDDLSEIVTSGGKRLGEKNARTMIDNLNAKITMPLHVFIGSLGIKGIGRSICKSIVDAGYDTIGKMREAGEYDIQEIPGMGELRAIEFTNGIVERMPIIQALLLNGVKISKPSAGSMKGKSVCMTGFRDAEMTETIESKGGTVKSSVSKDLTYLVQKDASSKSSKSDKAREYGVRVISQDDMWRILNGNIA